MPAIRHLAVCSNNNRRLARFYHLIFGMEEVWNTEQNSPYAFYLTDGYFNLNCLQLRPGIAEVKKDVGINHYGFRIENLHEVERRLGELDPPIRFAKRPMDGRYVEVRILDPDGNGVDLTETGWGGGEEPKLPTIRHLGIRTEDPERLAEFYRFVLAMKEVGRMGVAGSGAQAIYLSDGTINLALVKNSPIAYPGIQLIGFQILSVEEIAHRLQHSPPFLYPGEPRVEILRRPPESPYQSYYLKDPDGNYVDLSEKGWAA